MSPERGHAPSTDPRLERSDREELDLASNPAKLDFLPLAPLSLRARDAARLLGISQRSLWTITKRGDIPHVRIGRTVTYPVDGLRDWLKKRSKGGK